MKALSFKLSLLIAVFLFSCKNNSLKQESKPNILFIAIDDMNDWIGPLGGFNISQTPNLDKLASQSMVFENAHCASPACHPSRLSIMTGILPSKSGNMKNVSYDGPQWRKEAIFKDIETMEQFFKNRGYKTLAGGKIYHTLTPEWVTSSLIEPESWDFYFPSAYINAPYQMRAKEEVAYPPHFRGHRYKAFAWGPIDAEDEKMSDYQVVDWARYELKQKHEKPFFLACGIFRPHLPWEVPQKYFDMYPLEDIPDLIIQEDDVKDGIQLNSRRYMHKFVLENKQWKHVIQAYLASIAFADAQIGRLIETLNASEYRDNTIVVLWSDHGAHIGEKEVYEKFTLYEEATHVPFIIKAPGTTRPGSRSNQPVSLLDIYPTLAELTAYKIPEHCDGTSLLPLLINPETKREHSALTSYKMQGYSAVGHSLRSERYRYIYYTNLNLEELYDHQNDSNEFNNIAYDASNAGIVDAFRMELLERVGGLSINEMKKKPENYVIKDGKIENTKFISMEDFPLKEAKQKSK